MPALVGQLAKDASTMADAAREARDNPRVGIDAITRLDALYHASDSLYRHLMNGEDMAQTVNEYLAVRQAYFDARPFFDGLPDSDAVRAAIWRTRDNLPAVASAFLGAYQEAEAEASVKEPEPPADTHLRQTAADIARRSAHLDRQSRERKLRGLLPQADLIPFDELNNAAQSFYDYLAIHGDVNGVEVRGRYEKLVHWMQNVRDIIADSHVDMQAEFRIMWNEMDSIYKIAPDVHLGTLDWTDIYKNPPPNK